MARRPRRKCICDQLRWPRVISMGHDVKCPVHKVAYRPPERDFNRKGNDG
jgi:hypothetical protein